MSSALKFKKHYPAFLVIGGIAVLTLYCVINLSAPYFKSISADGEDGQSPVPEADIVLTGFRLMETEGTTTICKLEADKARIYQSRQTIQLNNVKVNLYNEQGKAMNIAGRTGEVNLETSDMTLRCGIKGTSAEGFNFRTECIQWNKRKDKIIGPAPVDIYYKDTQISAQQLEADPKKGTLILSGGVETLIRG